MELVNIKSIDNIAEAKQLLEIQENLLIKSSLLSNDAQDILKANNYLNNIAKKSLNENKSYIFDPWQWQNGFGFKDKSTPLSYSMLRRMGNTPIINSIITTRVEQVAQFSTPNYEDRGTGFQIRRKRSFFNKKNENTKEDEERIEWLTNFIFNCGANGNTWSNDDFNSFLRKFTRDSLELDQGTFEVVRNRRNLPIEFLATDGSTFRFADSYYKDKDKENELKHKEVNGYLPAYVQIYQSEIKNEYYPWELCFAIRNHYTDIRLNGYGVSELENISNVITWMLYSDTYNGKFFSQGSAPKGILKISGGVNDAKLAEFRQQWQSMVMGVQNAWRTPVMEADKMEWIDLQRNNTDMQFSKWQEYLIKLSCASYKIDPSEIGFPMSGSSDSKPMFEGNNEARLKYSKDKGLRPLLNMIETKINKYLISQLAPDYEFVFVGLDPEDESSLVDLDTKKLNSYMGIKEIRRMRGLPDMPEDDDIILNPYYMQAQQMKQQAQQGGDMQNMPPNEDEYNNGEEYQDNNSEASYEDFMNAHGSEKSYEDFMNNHKQENEDPFAKSFNDFLTKEFDNSKIIIK